MEATSPSDLPTTEGHLYLPMNLQVVKLLKEISK